MLLTAARTAAAASTSRSASMSARRAASSIANKYANAAYSAALKKSPQTLTKVQSELAAIANGIRSVPPLASFVSNPTLSSKDRTAGLEALFVAAEGPKKEPVSDVTKNLFMVLSENGRLVETQGVIEGFNELVSKYKGEVEVVVTSSSPLDRSTLARLEATLKQSQVGQQAKILKVTNKVNPSVLGGLVVDFGDKTIDLSVSSRVNKLNSIILQGV
ncbi:ATP synthase subunit 5 [Gautieria morchelliformis]|nr:ATP synthase subunit 5 [Gautieria morchelliformis]